VYHPLAVQTASAEISEDPRRVLVCPISWELLRTVGPNVPLIQNVAATWLASLRSAETRVQDPAELELSAVSSIILRFVLVQTVTPEIPFTNCVPKPPPPPEPVVTDPCNPSPCGSNAQCNNGVCSCLPEYQGDPYRGCRPECVLNTDCPRDRACVRNKCIDPCPGTCGQNAECNIYNHIPICTCIQGYTGNAFVLCTQIVVPVPQNPCSPSPCGPNSQCREINGQAVCSCIPGYIGSPPTCRPECVSSSECALNQACVNQKCIDPCPGTCGIGAKCQVVNHNPICSCPSRTESVWTKCSMQRNQRFTVVFLLARIYRNPTGLQA
jgi:hypothetical protein